VFLEFKILVQGLNCHEVISVALSTHIHYETTTPLHITKQLNNNDEIDQQDQMNEEIEDDFSSEDEEEFRHSSSTASSQLSVEVGISHQNNNTNDDGEIVEINNYRNSSENMETEWFDLMGRMNHFLELSDESELVYNTIRYQKTTSARGREETKDSDGSDIRLSNEGSITRKRNQVDVIISDKKDWKYDVVSYFPSVQKFIKSRNQPLKNDLELQDKPLNQDKSENGGSWWGWGGGSSNSPNSIKNSSQPSSPFMMIPFWSSQLSPTPPQPSQKEFEFNEEEGDGIVRWLNGQNSLLREDGAEDDLSSHQPMKNCMVSEDWFTTMVRGVTFEDSSNEYQVDESYLADDDLNESEEDASYEKGRGGRINEDDEVIDFERIGARKSVKEKLKERKGLVQSSSEDSFLASSQQESTEEVMEDDLSKQLDDILLEEIGMNDLESSSSTSTNKKGIKKSKSLSPRYDPNNSSQKRIRRKKWEKRRLDALKQIKKKNDDNNGMMDGFSEGGDKKKSDIRMNTQKQQDEKESMINQLHLMSNKSKEDLRTLDKEDEEDEEQDGNLEQEHKNQEHSESDILVFDEDNEE